MDGEHNEFAWVLVLIYVGSDTERIIQSANTYAISRVGDLTPPVSFTNLLFLLHIWRYV